MLGIVWLGGVNNAEISENGVQTVSMLLLPSSELLKLVLQRRTRTPVSIKLPESLSTLHQSGQRNPQPHLKVEQHNTSLAEFANTPQILDCL